MTPGKPKSNGGPASRADDSQPDLKWVAEWLVEREGQRRTAALLGVNRKTVALALRRERLTGRMTLAVQRLMGDDELLRRSLGREDKLQRTVWELDRTVTELERKRDVAREAALASRQVHKELEEAYRKETAAHKETKDLLNMIRVIAIVLFVLLVGSVLV